MDNMGTKEDRRGVSTPGTSGVTQNVKAGGRTASEFRMLAARCNYLEADRPDIQYAVQELYRKMSNPDDEAWMKLKRFARYLKDEGILCYEYVRQEAPLKLTVWSHSDHAGCKETRKSTTGGAAMLGKHCVKSWSVTQPKVALSGGEAEYYGVV